MLRIAERHASHFKEAKAVMCQHKLRASSCTGGVQRAAARERWRSLAIYLTEVVLACSFSVFERRCVKETQCGTPEGDPLDPGLISAAL